MLKRHSQFFKGLLCLVDLLVVTLAWWFAFLLRFHTSLFPSPEPYLFRDYFISWLLILVVWGAVFAVLDLYRPRRISTRLREMVDMFRGSFTALLVFLGLIFLLHDIVLSRIVVVIFWLSSVVLLDASHLLFREGLRFLRRRGYNLRHVLVLGSQVQVQRLVQKLTWHRHLGVRVIGVYLTDSKSAPKEFFEGVRLLRNPAEVKEWVGSGSVDQVFITLPLNEAGRLREFYEWLDNELVAIHFVPDIEALATVCGHVETFDGLYIISLQDSPLYGWSSVIKRSMDLALGGLALILFAPIMILVALGIKWRSPGNVFYKQERMGLDGQRFQMLKFRTMVQDAERLTGPVWATIDDPRITALGRWLRQTSLDELPQLINVLKGEMSLVGPRPERPPLIDEFRRSIPKYMLRHKMKAGMTGWAQVNGLRGNTSLERRIEHDLDYIENWSLWRDFKILGITLFRGFRDKNASQAGSRSGRASQE
jgi:Undecaprenyl-phosphate glucose phosphotransferase